MVTYNIETEIGVCECYECNGVYHPVYEAEADKFIGEVILSIERNDKEK